MNEILPPAGGSTAGAATPPPAKPSSPSDIKRRAQGLPPLTPEQEAAIANSWKTKESAPAVKADEIPPAGDAKPPAEKKIDPVPPVEKVRKVKAGPPLPEPSKAADGKSIETLVREALEKEKPAKAAAPKVAPEIERELELARFAEKKNPEAYGGFADKVTSYYEARDELLSAKAKELGGQNSHEFRDYVESDEFKEWAKSARPAYQRGDVAKLQEDMIADRTREQVKAEMAPEMKALERKTREIEHARDINDRVQRSVQIIITDTAAEKEPAMVQFAANPQKFGEDYPEEAKLIANEATEAMEQIREVYRIDRDIVEFNPSRPTDTQQKIKQFLVKQNTALREKYPNGIEMDGGKILVDAETYHSRNLGNDARYRLFQADEIAGMIAATKNEEVREKLRVRREGVAKSFYSKKEAPATTPPDKQETTADNEERTSPDAVVSRSSGAKGKPILSKYDQLKAKHLNGKG